MKRGHRRQSTRCNSSNCSAATSPGGHLRTRCPQQLRAGRCPGARRDASQQDESVRAPDPRWFHTISFSFWPCLDEHSSGYGFLRGRAAAARAAQQLLEQDRRMLINRHGADPGAAATAPRWGRREGRAHVLLPGGN